MNDGADGHTPEARHGNLAIWETTNDNEDVYLPTGATLYDSVLTIIADSWEVKLVWLKYKKSLEYKAILRYI